MRNKTPHRERRFVVLVTALLASAVAFADDTGSTAAEQEAVNQLVGGWRLVSRVITGPDGKALVDLGYP